MKPKSRQGNEVAGPVEELAVPWPVPLAVMPRAGVDGCMTGDTQPFRVRYRDGRQDTGETRGGFLKGPSGSFLFVVGLSGSCVP